MRSTYLSPTRKKTKTTKKVFGTIIDKDGNKTKTLLQQVSILLLKKKKNTSSILNASIIEKIVILPISLLKLKTRSQKTSTSLDNFCVNRPMWIMTLSSSKKKSVSDLLDLISEVNVIYPIFIKELGLRVRSIT